MPQQTEIFEEQWDKKKIAVGISFLVLGITAFVIVKNMFFPNFSLSNTYPQPVVGKQVQGVATTNQPSPVSFSFPSQQDIQQKIQHIQDQVMDVNVGDIASSSPQIQGILKQIQELPHQPGNMAKSACMQLCNNL